MKVERTENIDGYIYAGRQEESFQDEADTKYIRKSMVKVANCA